MVYNCLYKKVVIAEESLWSDFLPRFLRISRARNKMYYKFLLFHLLSLVTHLCVNNASDYSLYAEVGLERERARIKQGTNRARFSSIAECRGCETFYSFSLSDN